MMRTYLLAFALLLVSCIDGAPEPADKSEPMTCAEWIYSHDLQLPNDGQCWGFHTTSLDVALKAPELNCALPSYGCEGIGPHTIEVWARPFRSDGAWDVTLSPCGDK